MSCPIYFFDELFPSFIIIAMSFITSRLDISIVLSAKEKRKPASMLLPIKKDRTCEFATKKTFSLGCKLNRRMPIAVGLNPPHIQSQRLLLNCHPYLQNIAEWLLEFNSTGIG
jgi:hypothetical protein